MHLRSIIIIGCLLGAISCSNRKGPQANQIHAYYDLEGLLTEQVALLDSLDPAVHKTAKIDSITEREVIQPDTTWSRELEMFFQADINAPVLRGSYRISEEEEGGQKVKIFEAKDKEKAGVEYLKVYFHQDAVQKIEAFYKEKNALYNSQRKMTLNFQGSTGENPLLSSYEVRGKHKMIMREPVTFQITGELTY